MAAKIVFLCATALLVQVAYGQYLPFAPSASGNSVVTNQINTGNVGNNFANSGNALANGGLSTVGVANTGLSGIGRGNAGYNLANSGITLANGGLSTVGVANTGLSGIGRGNGGLIGGNVGVVGAGLNGVNAPLLAYPDLLNIGSSGPLTVTVISPIGPSGLAVASENVMEGSLFVTGSLPFLSAVAFENAFPTVGSGVATCGCGNGAVGILDEGFPNTTPAIGINRLSV